MRLTLSLAAFALLTAAAAPVAAQATPPAPPTVPAAASTEQHPAHAKRVYMSMDKRFQAANTTHDGHLTADQARASSHMHTVSANFDAIDKDHKGFVTEDDIRAWYKARREARKLAKEQAAGKS
ncbi:MAG: EF-hand domain-containing protein [Acetobacteraceae bacterium]